MTPHTTNLVNCYTARLSRKIVFWIFLSLIIIEGIILIPSVQRKKQELLEQFKQLYAIKIAWIMLNYSQASESELLAQIEQMKTDPKTNKILGGSLYHQKGKLLANFGENPQLSLNQISAGINQLETKNHRYDIAYQGAMFSDRYILILRYDLAELYQQILAYIGRIIILVIIIALVITAATIIVLGKIVIIPILRLRDDLIAAGEILSQENNQFNPEQIYSFSVQRQDELGEVMKAFKQMFERVFWEIEQRKNVEENLRIEKEQSEKLLLNILPESIAERLKQEETCIADGFTEVSILFADIVGFTSLSQQVSPQELVALLNHIFSLFDQLTEKYQLEKIKTIGDAYMVASGLPQPRQDHAQAIVEMSLDMQSVITQFNAENSRSLSIRIGINTGSVVAGVIGKKKFIYDLWGDAVNIASRMESHGIPGAIQVTQTTYECLKNLYLFEERGIIDVKGKGKMMTYLLIGNK